MSFFIDPLLTTYKSLFLLLCITLCAADEALNPALPRQCYSCEGINCLRTSKQNVTTDCIDQLDYCVSIFQDYTVVARGCYGNLAPAQRHKCDLDSAKECNKCFGQLCNAKSRADFKCIVCNSNEHSSCEDDTSTFTPQSCDMPTASNSYCFVRESPGISLTRGCLVHQREQLECLKDAHCSMCLGADALACNSYKVQMSATAGGDANRRASVPMTFIALAMALLLLPLNVLLTI